MSEILCRLRVDVWRRERPEVSWVFVSRRTKTSVKYDVRHSVRGEIKTVEHSFPRRWLEKVNPEWKKPDQPGVCEICWCQDDREPIHGGVGYNMAMIAVLDRIDDDMQRAAVRIREMKEALYAGGGMD